MFSVDRQTTDLCSIHFAINGEQDAAPDMATLELKTVSIGTELYSRLERMANNSGKDVSRLVEEALNAHLLDLQADMWAQRTWLR